MHVTSSNHYIQIKTFPIPPDFQHQLDKHKISIVEICDYLNAKSRLGNTDSKNILSHLGDEFLNLAESETSSSPAVYQVQGLILSKHSSLNFNFFDADDNVQTVTINLSADNLAKIGMKLNCTKNYDEIIADMENAIILTTRFDHAFVEDDSFSSDNNFDNFNAKLLTINYVEINHYRVIQSVEYDGWESQWEAVDTNSGRIDEYELKEDCTY